MAMFAIGLALGIASATFFYAGSPHQRLISRPLRYAGRAGSLCALLSLACLLTAMGPATSVFVLMTILVLVLTLLPFAATFRPRRGGGA